MGAYLPEDELLLHDGTHHLVLPHVTVQQVAVEVVLHRHVSPHGGAARQWVAAHCVSMSRASGDGWNNVRVASRCLMASSWASALTHHALDVDEEPLLLLLGQLARLKTIHVMPQLHMSGIQK